MCATCAGQDHATNERQFRAGIEARGGRVVGKYANARTAVECICVRGHTWLARANDLQQGRGGCRTCARKDPVATEAAFRTNVAALGGTIVGPYVNAYTPIKCVCAAGHVCNPQPTSVQQGHGICRTCVGKVWDVFYVVTNPNLYRVKFGITTGDPRPRLVKHRGAGYTDVVRLHRDFPDAIQLERHVMNTLRDARIPPVHGREYYGLDALPVVLDVVDGWTALPALPT